MTLNFKKMIERLCKALPKLQAIYLFGSFAQNTMREESDVDIAILPSVPLKKTKLFELSQQISEILHREVDLVDLSTAAVVFRFQVISTGKRLYCLESKQCAFFETLVFSMYYRFNEERKDLLNAIYERGSIYL